MVTNVHLNTVLHVLKKNVVKCCEEVKEAMPVGKCSQYRQCLASDHVLGV